MNENKSITAYATRYLKYTLSLPERMIRALASLAAGTTTLLTENLLPGALRRTKTYQITFGMMQQFVVEQIAGIQDELPDPSSGTTAGFAQRKMAGTALEAAGLLTVGASPLWLFAIVGDAAGGSKVFLNRLLAHLKSRKILAPDAQADNLVDLLAALQDAASTTATAIDTPPLSRTELSQLAEDLKKGYGNTFRSTTNLVPRLEDIWQWMERTARVENISVERLGGIMTLDVLSKGAGTIVAAGSTSFQLFDDHILDSYRETLGAISEKGVSVYIGTHYQPFLQAVKKHFDANQSTLTERSLWRKDKED